MVEGLQAIGIGFFLTVVAVVVWGLFIFLFTAMTCHYVWRIHDVLERMAPPVAARVPRGAKVMDYVLVGAAACVLALVIIFGIVAARSSGRGSVAAPNAVESSTVANH
jgi:hypothetical protein